MSEYDFDPFDDNFPHDGEGSSVVSLCSRQIICTILYHCIIHCVHDCIIAGVRGPSGYAPPYE